MRIEFTSEILNKLKAKGFKTIYISLLNQQNLYRATIELVPVKDLAIGPDVISINAQELHDYAKTNNPMVAYVIKSDYCF